MNNHKVCNESGAWVFPKDPTVTLSEENAALRKLLGAVIDALPAKARASIPAEDLKALQDGN